MLPADACPFGQVDEIIVLSKLKAESKLLGELCQFSKWLLIHKWVDLCNDNSPGPDSLSHIYKQSILGTKIHYSCKFFLETKAFQKAQLIFFPFWWRIFSFPLEKKQKQKVLNFVRKTVLLEKRKTRQLVNSKTKILEPKNKKEWYISLKMAKTTLKMEPQ